eukprot:1387583-Amorphochlora_amoeboformis.AAC.2
MGFAGNSLQETGDSLGFESIRESARISRDLSDAGMAPARVRRARCLLLSLFGVVHYTLMGLTSISFSDGSSFYPHPLASTRLSYQDKAPIQTSPSYPSPHQPNNAGMSSSSFYIDPPLADAHTYAHSYAQSGSPGFYSASKTTRPGKGYHNGGYGDGSRGSREGEQDTLSSISITSAKDGLSVVEQDVVSHVDNCAGNLDVDIGVEGVIAGFNAKIKGIPDANTSLVSQQQSLSSSSLSSMSSLSAHPIAGRLQLVTLVIHHNARGLDAKLSREPRGVRVVATRSTPSIAKPILQDIQAGDLLITLNGILLSKLIPLHSIQPVGDLINREMANKPTLTITAIRGARLQPKVHTKI